MDCVACMLRHHVLRPDCESMGGCPQNWGRLSKAPQIQRETEFHFHPRSHSEHNQLTLNVWNHTWHDTLVNRLASHGVLGTQPPEVHVTLPRPPSAEASDDDGGLAVGHVGTLAAVLHDPRLPHLQIPGASRVAIANPSKIGVLVTLVWSEVDGTGSDW